MRFFRSEWSRSLTMQMLLTSAGALLAMLALVAAVAVIGNDGQSLVEHELADHTEQIRAALRFDAAGRPMAAALSGKAGAMFNALPKDTAFRVLDRRGAVLLESDPGPALDALQREPFDGKASSTTVATRDGIALHVRVVPMRHHGWPYFYIMQVAQSDRIALLRHLNGGDIFLVTALASVTLAVLVMGVVIVLTMRRMARSIKNATALVVGIDARDLQVRLDPSSLARELAPLIDGFNQALARLGSQRGIDTGAAGSGSPPGRKAKLVMPQDG